jgi:N-6 DNA Methylase./Eco57I restriction endonuclease.
VFSREAVWSGAFDQYAASKRKRGTSEVDSEFLKEIEGWRDVLARNIALRNPGLSLDDLNLAVQLTIDRIVFLRMAEDRGIEPFEQLLKLCERTEIYAHFVRVLCRKADDKYNSGLFHFEREPGVAEAPDRLTPCLKIDDKAIKPILQSLYFEYGSPYQFGVMPVEILGTVYERFLGKVIRLTEGHQAKIEEKPEVRKAGGVYYTPAYIVDYIVKNTVGKKIEDKSPAQLAGGKNGPPLRVLDMACGSGSFLLGAYQRLLDHCLTWYQGHKPESHKKAVYQDSRKGDWRLTIEEKKRILTTHVFGVDIDPQAVEVTKLSLLLKVLEGETDQTFGDQMKLFQTRALPNLSNNIKCGNSLIGPDYFSGRLIPDPEELKRVNPFDWNAGFPEAMKAGGFDCVIGNPPYVRQEILGPRFKEYARKSFATYAGTADLYTYFIEKGVSLLTPDGLFSYIVANKWMRANYGEPLRLWLKSQGLEEITDFGDLPVFKGATTYPCILRIRKTSPGSDGASRSKVDVSLIRSLDFRDLSEYVGANSFFMTKSGLDDKGWSLVADSSRRLLDKILSVGIPLENYVQGKIFRGVLTGLNEAFVIDQETRENLVRKDRKSTEIIKPFLAGRDIKRYSPPISNKYLIFSRRGIKISEYPTIYEHLLPYKNKLIPRPEDWKGKEWQGRKPGAYQWYEIQDTVAYYKEFEKPKIIYPNICTKPEFSIDYSFSFANQKCFIIPLEDIFLLGILNSKLSYFLFKMIFPRLRGGFYEPSYIYMKTFPIQDFMERERKLFFLETVERMIAFSRQLSEVGTVSQKSILQRQIEATDREIDQLVYELYGLTDEEIKIVEGETS